MCGITGYLNLNGQNKFNSGHLETMLKTIEYRGPNDKGVFADNLVGLGHRRLSIIDLSSAGHQPMFSDDKSLVIIFNGEIYNYLEIKEELKHSGCNFSTGTDTEVILAAYQKWGENCVEKFNGMWAFVIWDLKEKKLFASRDRFGVKPFYYQLDQNYFLFGSEIKTILAVSLTPRKINYPFLYNFIDRHIPYGCAETVFENIKTLLPAHNLIIKNGQVQIKRYWQINPDEFKKKYDYSNPEKTFRQLLIDATKLRLRSDVPVGVCLSGGIDSTTITGIITKILGQKIKTFSSIYNEKDYGEGQFIEIANQYYQTEANLIYPNADNFFDIVDKLISHHDEPVRMPGTYSQWHVMECAAREVIVTLDGQGADELLGGYRWFYPDYLASLINEVTHFKAGTKNISKYLETRKELKNYLNQTYDKDVLKILTPKCLLNLKRQFKPENRWQDQILNQKFLAAKTPLPPTPKIFFDPLNQALFEAFTTTNLPHLLNYEDKISMAFSLEARVPFMDYRIVEFCFGLPYSYKINGYKNKAILRDAFQDILPPEIFNRKDKKGFPTPNEHWFRNELKNQLKKLFYSPTFNEHGLFNTSDVQKIFEQHLAGKNHERLLWRIITLELWLNKYFN
ncbi:MAG: asparagine synthase (glutamine-hydrolyzing) [Candidatus Buchananbacteria bacterium]